MSLNRTTEGVCPGLFKCKYDNICVHPNNLCDGIKQCSILGDDELLCDPFICPEYCTCLGSLVDCSHSLQSSLPILGRNLKALFFHNNQLTKLEPISYALLIKLDLSSNNLWQLTSGLFLECTMLLYLDLSNNLISSVSSDSFQGLVKLIYLSLMHNPIAELQVHSFRGLTALPSFQLVFNGLHLPSCIFEDLTDLEILIIEKTGLQQFSSRLFCHMPRLRRIEMRQNIFDNIIGDPFSYLPMLSVVETDDERLCCLVPDRILCLNPNTSVIYCQDLISSKSLKVIILIFACFVLISNSLSFMFGAYMKRENKIAIFVWSLNLFDFLMGCYLLTVALADISYGDKFIWHEVTWKTSVYCTALPTV